LTVPRASKPQQGQVEASDTAIEGDEPLAESVQDPDQAESTPNTAEVVAEPTEPQYENVLTTDAAELQSYHGKISKSEADGTP
jgi:hypothetical protein